VIVILKVFIPQKGDFTSKRREFKKQGAIKIDYFSPMILKDKTICALATPYGSGAIAVIRLSGKDTFAIGNRIFKKKNAPNFSFEKAKGNSIHFGYIVQHDQILDEVLISVFKQPYSYTGEDTLEISCHGSPYIIQEIISLCVDNGAVSAMPGEFTQAAFLNGKLDLVQAEAVADVIAADSKAAHQMAMMQLRGGFSNQINQLRNQLIEFAALIELELDFAEEDVTFADRSELVALIHDILKQIKQLIESFSQGNVLKTGIPVAIIGRPNAGKSTLLNALLNEDRAIVSEIAGTTRDTIEEKIHINGLSFRFIDTAGIRSTEDVIEKLGIEKTFEKIKQAAIILYVFDIQTMIQDDLNKDIQEITVHLEQNQQLFALANKIDLLRNKNNTIAHHNLIAISAKEKSGVQALKNLLSEYAAKHNINNQSVIITNIRHLQSLKGAQEALEAVLSGIDQHITSDFLALDIRSALRHLGDITGTIDVDKDILGTIFGRFCIGK
jgi:tRNA modification GTPase